ncbi:D-2-hydroxyacid dehydrogenase [Novosphingobium cyanobacteriorum]|uniref:D-2-hydroxyacid dehydrogenase n=1 Tax=Novosphingobium cyanobacteriorum TaxID=3024215 RepID=A0ABT6CGT3_9SPHN|nr:D-2-hydroxyacid dehydrogenase [Novosphingobium cyanobacteriorum]MDF8332295.1 D-2-hydroxyacid dehydrogenase [Novosphingobium cyanobacteriorum]
MNAMAAPVIAPHLPEWVEPHYFRSTEELFELAPQAEIGWFDLYQPQGMAEAIRRAGRLRWLNSIYAGVDFFPLPLLAERGVVLTNGAGINAITIAEYVVMGMLTIAKGYREVVRAQDRHEWLLDSPGKVELAGSRALILGAGEIGGRVARMLAGFEVEVTTVRRAPGEGTLTPDQWRARLGEFDWVILAVPATPETDGMIGAAELAAMKRSAVLINVARGTVVDQEALIAALEDKRIGGAFLDVTTPEPLPAEHPLWNLPNAHVTMHLSGRAQDRMFVRAVQRFLANLGRFQRGEPLSHRVDLSRGY